MPGADPEWSQGGATHPTFEAGLRVEMRQTGRGERDNPAANDLASTRRLAEPPEPLEFGLSA